MNATQFVLYTYPKQGNSDTLCHTYGPDAESTCEAAAANLDQATTGFMVLPLEPLTPPQSKLSQKLDEQAADRADHMKELQHG